MTHLQVRAGIRIGDPAGNFGATLARKRREKGRTYDAQARSPELPTSVPVCACRPQRLWNYFECIIRAVA